MEHPATAIEVARLWLAVTRSGGAAGFPADAPSKHVTAAADALLADVGAGHAHLLGERTDGVLTGIVVLRPGAGAVFEHRAELSKLMVHPGHQRSGTGRRLLDRAIGRARALGLRQLRLSTRGGTHLPEYYRRAGWTEVGRFPAALQIAPGDFRDEHWFQYDLG
ncbi:hypothetical protein GCM10027445_69360 [Amycolatopsis endophytica]|uniref:GNAT superfamily N-acetyltransferase n=1 Tax=Amycolatopsis endophytica TaxID=860233 RepID=A0A853B6M8_9PSEU|nr:GNAT family N-acetyltransferase [Amycolatopsis endophytica]NYI90729.1 GNAT superfamily N-acetyltransferase [Amycolatopsis endophytica]